MPRPSDASTSRETRESFATGQTHQASDDDVDPTEEGELSGSPPKRIRTVSDLKLSASDVESILTADVPDLGLFPIDKVRNSAATHDRLKEKLLKSRFVPKKTWVAPKRQRGQKRRSVSADFLNQELYPCIRYSVTRDALYCIVCILFGSQNIMLTTEPLTDWSNAK